MTTPRFFPLQVAAKRPETADAVSLLFVVPPELRESYSFTQGQFVTLRQQINGVEARRSYSICAGVEEYQRTGELRVGVKRVAGGLFSNWINGSLQAGDRIDVMTPDGRFFTPLDAGQSKHYVAFAGGSGITPVLSLIKTTLATERASRFTLVYGNRTINSIMFIEELEDLKNRYLDRLSLYHVLSDEAQDIALFNGLLDRARCDALLSNLIPASAIDEAFVCGPEPMMDAAEAALLAAGVAKENIHIERFGVPMPASAPKDLTASAQAAGHTGELTDVEIIINGKSRHLKVPRSGAGILDAGLAAGIDLPYACKGGVCCTCRARVVEGSVRMDKNYTLEDWETAKGFVLTCQSHPTSERVVVNYDDR